MECITYLLTIGKLNANHNVDVTTKSEGENLAKSVNLGSYKVVGIMSLARLVLEYWDQAWS